jgi:uncharacterized protein (TIGR03437 family)
MKRSDQQHLRIRRIERIRAAGVLALFTIFSATAAQAASETRPDAGSQARQTAKHGFASMPLYFVENRGQVGEGPSYYIQGRNKTIYFSSTGVTFALNAPAGSDAEHGQSWAVELDFIDTNTDALLEGQDSSSATISYFRRSEQADTTGLRTYKRLWYENLWPGIHLAYAGQEKQLKYEFIVDPGADPARIRLAYRGAEVSLKPSGQLEVATPLGGFVDDRPVAFQDAKITRTEVDVAYDLAARADDGSVVYGFRVGDYDRSRTLVIDPAVIVYAGFLGGTENDAGNDIAVDTNGNVYIVGTTNSPQQSFPAQVGPSATFRGGGACVFGLPCGDAFVAKLNPAGELMFAGYIGGDGIDNGVSIAVDISGAAYITGSTTSRETSFPVKVGPDLTYNSAAALLRFDAFVAKIDPSGTSLVYAGYIGGAENDNGTGIAVDSAGNAYVSGNANSPQSSFPVRVGPDVTHNSFTPNNQSTDAFIAKVRADGTGLVYAGYIGGVSGETSAGVAVDTNGSAYVTGTTFSRQDTFPSLIGPDTTYNDGPLDFKGDAYIVKVKADGTGFDYAGFIGGRRADLGASVAVDHLGNAYVSGQTTSDESSFPVAVGPDLTYNTGGECPTFPFNAPCTDTFVAKVKADGTGLSYAGYIGGSNHESGPIAVFGNGGIAVDRAGNAYVTGMTFSTEAGFPVTDGPGLTFNEATCGSFPFQGPCAEAFVAKVNAAGTSLLYAGYIGGAGDDHGNGIAVDEAGNAYVVGTTGFTGAGFPAVGGPGVTFNGGRDAFVAKIGSAAAPDIHQITGVVDAAGFRGLIAPGSIVAVFGGFAESTRTSASLPLATTLEGLSVTFNGIEAALFGVFGNDSGLGFNQANVQVPWNLDVSDGTVAVRVHWQVAGAEVGSEPFEAAAAPAAPGIFTFEFGAGPAIVQNLRVEKGDVIANSFAQPEGSIEGVIAQPAPVGGIITVWANGLGPVTDTPPAGNVPGNGNGLSETTKTVRLFIGGIEATIVSSPVLHPSLVGLNQINAVVPDTVIPGDAVPIVIEVECGDDVILRGRTDVTIAVRPRP